MTTVFDSTTGQPVDATPEEAASGIIAGTHAVGASQPILLKSPDGSFVKPKDNASLPELLRGGYNFPTTQEETEHRVEKEERSKGLYASFQEAAESAINQFALGVPEAIQGETDTPQEAEEREARDKFHSVARTLGGLGGFVGSLVTGGEIFKGLETAGEAVSHAIVPAEKAAQTGLLANVAAKAASAATQGAIYATPAALAQAAWGDPQKAAETLLWGVGTGALLGGGAELAGEGVSGVKSVVTDNLLGVGAGNKLDQWANNTALNAVGATSGKIGKLDTAWRQEAGDYLTDLIKPGMSRQDLGDAVSRKLKEVGSGMGAAIDQLDSSIAEKNLLTAAPLADHFLRPGELASAIKEGIGTDPGFFQHSNAPYAEALNKLVADAANLPTVTVDGQRVVDFRTGQDFVSALRGRFTDSVDKKLNESVGGMRAVTPADEIKSRAYFFARDALHEAADRVAVESNNPQLVGALGVAKREYAKAATLEGFAQNLDRIDAAKSFSNSTAFLRSGHGPLPSAGAAVGAAIGGAIGGIPGAVAGGATGHLAGGIANFIANRWLGDYGMVAASRIAKHVANEGPDVFSAVLGAESSQRLQRTLKTIHDTVSQLAIRGAATVARPDHMPMLIGNTSGLTPSQAYAKLASRLTSISSNPAAMATSMGTLTAPIVTSAPQVAAAYQAKQLQAVSYLANALPKNPVPPTPFAPNNWSPGPKEKLGFSDRAEIVANPMSAMRHLQQGTLSAAHIEALQTIYPVIYSMMQKEILEWSSKHPDAKLPMRERASVDKFLGIQSDPLSNPQSLQQVQALYQSLPNPDQEDNISGPSKPIHGKLKNLPSSATAFSATTGESQL